MSSPRTRFVARLKGLKAVTNLVGMRVFPIIAPQGTKYPNIVYQVVGYEPEGTAQGTTGTFRLRVRVSCLGLTDGGDAAYTSAWSLADAVIGDCSASPSGMEGWNDDQGDVWHLTECHDEIGEIKTGRDTFEAFVVTQVYELWNSVTEN